MSGEKSCPLCGACFGGRGRGIVSVRSNVRAFQHERFRMRRCDSCESIHAIDDVDLNRYYAEYPFFRQKLNGAVRLTYRHLLVRLARAGLRRGHRILDFGCGSGLLVKFLRKKGYDAIGYDPYAPEGSSVASVCGTFDFIIAQDVVEHSPDPLETLGEIDRLCRPGGLIAIGTPNASAIDLSMPEKFVHPLHQPYHRHIFSLRMLVELTGKRHWQVKKYFSTPYTNVPLLSLPFLHHYMRCFDNTLDVLFDRPTMNAKLLLDPRTYILPALGCLLCDEADIMLILEKSPRQS